jgi:hypothetical protein
MGMNAVMVGAYTFYISEKKSEKIDFFFAYCVLFPSKLRARRVSQGCKKNTKNPKKVYIDTLSLDLYFKHQKSVNLISIQIQYRNNG